MTKVKICGITNLEDAMLSAKFGADALGFNFYEKSPRYILPEDTRNIIDELPEDILNVGVFVNEDLEKVIEIAKTASLDAIQLHGEESPAFAKELKTKSGLEIIKAFRVSEDFKTEDVLQYEVDAILLDAYSPKEHGGTGETFDWEIAKRVKEIFPKMYLAGGISYENIDEAILQINPIGVDVCSGLESTKGIKDIEKVNSFANNFNKVQDSLLHLEKPEKADLSQEEFLEMIESVTSTDYYEYVNKLIPKIKGKIVIDAIVGHSGFILVFDDGTHVVVYLEENKLNWNYDGKKPESKDDLINNSKYKNGFEKLELDVPYADQICSIKEEIINCFGKEIKTLAIGKNSFNFCFPNRMELDSMIFQNEKGESILRVFWEQW